MAKVHKIEDIHVRVYPEDPMFERLRTTVLTIDACKAIAADIRRHVDGCGGVDWHCTESDVCSFCGAPWEEKMDARDISPACCEAACDEWEAEHGKG